MLGSPPTHAAGAGGQSSSWAWPPDAGASAGSSNFERPQSKPSTKGFDDLQRWLICACAAPVMSYMLTAVYSDSQSKPWCNVVVVKYKGTISAGCCW
eukprot:430750-Pyramimonas_sp.AAC.1